ncbi:MAG: GcrA-like regulator [Bradyrhizobium sp.]|uniref:GcrA family cell cycle regulator n=1 Tax=Bradyrhizobium sp. TaxID=376 RepID=UPI0025C365E6|nr:GcrA family cell cycle regulator [Bradyrhizobium sp.]MBI5261593.1 GcrA-like regulator [Bradyrhizobium sp.]
MRAIEPTWTEERLTLLMSHFEAGLSCRQIAAEIGVSRNAVIGKLSRLNVTRDTAVRAVRTNRVAPQQRESVRKLRGVLAAMQAATAREARKDVIDDWPDDGQRCSIFELSKERCRWPLNMPENEGFGFCGRLPLEGFPYCPGHCRLAYRATSNES